MRSDAISGHQIESTETPKVSVIDARHRDPCCSMSSLGWGILDVSGALRLRSEKPEASHSTISI